MGGQRDKERSLGPPAKISTSTWDQEPKRKTGRGQEASSWPASTLVGPLAGLSGAGFGRMAQRRMHPSTHRPKAAKLEPPYSTLRTKHRHRRPAWVERSPLPSPRLSSSV